MSKFKVVVTDYVFPNLEPEKEILAGAGAELVAGQCKTREELLQLVPGAHGILNTYFGKIDGGIMDAMPDCRIIVRYGIGVDTIDIPAATARGILVANVPDYCIDEVSDQAVAMLLALNRKLLPGDRNVRAGNWKLGALKPMKRLSHLTVGILGMGRIGRAIAVKTAVFGSKVIFSDPYFKGEAPAGAWPVAFAELLEQADAIIVQAPSTPETKHLLNEAAFSRMLKKPVIVNCARGELIDTEALVRALETGRVSGAALDVIENTPPLAADHPLLKFDNVIVTPHSAWFSEDALFSLQRLAAQEVARTLQGERPKALLNPEAWEKRRGK